MVVQNVLYMYLKEENNGYVVFKGNIQGQLQGVTKRCRLSWLTNSALVYEPKCGGRGGVAGSESLWLPLIIPSATSVNHLLLISQPRFRKTGQNFKQSHYIGEKIFKKVTNKGFFTVY